MRPFETVLGCIVFGSAAVSLFKEQRYISLALLGAMLSVLLLHVILEGTRLSALPLYVAAIVLVSIRFLPTAEAARMTASVSCLVLAVLGLLACYMIPVISFPDPGGPFAIGTSTFYFTDPARKEQFASTPSGKREFAAQVWYPAQVVKGPSEPYRDRRSLSLRSQHLRLVKTHAWTDAPLLTGGQKFPVIFFSPAAGGNRNQNTYLSEFLVSHGYVVIAFDHPDSCARVPFPDGSVIKGLPDVWLNLDSREALAQSSIRTEHILQTNVGDMEYLLNQLESSAVPPHLNAIAQEMDFQRIAAVGHSFGGAAAAELCRTDPRFRAGINMDGWMFSGVNEHGIPRPFLFMIEDDPLWFKNEGPYPDNTDGTTRWGTRQYHDAIQHSVRLWGGCIARLRNGTHEDFADGALYRRSWPWVAGRSPSVQLLHEAIKRLALAFLDENLKNKTGAMAAARVQLADYFDLNCVPQSATPLRRTQSAH
jgi:pimeloyl-ACP methyl ester carboxylesterase